MKTKSPTEIAEDCRKKLLRIRHIVDVGHIIEEQRADGTLFDKEDNRVSNKALKFKEWYELSDISDLIGHSIKELLDQINAK